MYKQDLRWIGLGGLLLAAGCLAPEVRAQAGSNGPVQVYILAGQSNMEGHGYAEPVTWLKAFDRPQASLTNLAKHPIHGQDFAKYQAVNGRYPKRPDVWCHFRKGDKDMVGDLTVGFGANDTSRAWNIGPELGFGWVVGEATASQVLLIKTAWGGKSLAKDFRPPSSGGTVGEYYTLMVKQTKDVLANLQKHFPAYNGQGYKLAGFGWHQGWNDLVNEAYVNEYEKNLANFIRDVRKDLEAPGLPFVVAESGMACWDTKNATAQKLCAAQAAPAGYPEFKGTVDYVKARDYYDTSLAPWKDWGYHWHGSFYSYERVGKAMGETLLKLAGTPSAGPVLAASPGWAVAWTAQGLRWNRRAEVKAWTSQGRLIGRWVGKEGTFTPWRQDFPGSKKPILQVLPIP